MCGIECFQTSAVSGFNVERCFLTVIQMAYNHKQKNAGTSDSLLLKQQQ